MERYVLFIISGGLTLLVGLWLSRLSTLMAPLWILGLVAIIIGIGILGAGIQNGLNSPL